MTNLIIITQEERISNDKFYHIEFNDGGTKRTDKISEQTLMNLVSRELISLQNNKLEIALSAEFADEVGTLHLAYTELHASCEDTDDYSIEYYVFLHKYKVDEYGIDYIENEEEKHYKRYNFARRFAEKQANVVIETSL